MDRLVFGLSNGLTRDEQGVLIFFSCAFCRPQACLIDGLLWVSVRNLLGLAVFNYCRFFRMDLTSGFAHFTHSKYQFRSQNSLVMTCFCSFAIQNLHSSLATFVVKPNTSWASTINGSLHQLNYIFQRRSILHIKLTDSPIVRRKAEARTCRRRANFINFEPQDSNQAATPLKVEQ